MQHDSLDEFLASVEKRAYRMARLATRNDDDALDIVQDAMMKLASRYGDKGAAEWKPLFFRILENAIMDWHRKESVRRRWFFWRREADGEGEAPDPEPSDEAGTEPSALLDGERLTQAVLEAIESMPLRQQQCFLLRYWEGLSVKETAEAMGVDTGSVKTQAHRAVQKLNLLFEAQDHG